MQRCITHVHIEHIRLCVSGGAVVGTVAVCVVDQVVEDGVEMD